MFAQDLFSLLAVCISPICRFLAPVNSEATERCIGRYKVRIAPKSSPELEVECQVQILIDISSRRGPQACSPKRGLLLNPPGQPQVDGQAHALSEPPPGVAIGAYRARWNSICVPYEGNGRCEPRDRWQLAEDLGHCS